MLFSIAKWFHSSFSLEVLEHLQQLFLATRHSPLVVAGFSGFNFTKATMSTPSEKAEAYHYIAETLKFANSEKAKMEDPAFSHIKEVGEACLELYGCECSILEVA